MALTRASKDAIVTFSKKRRFQNAWINSAGPSRYTLLFARLPGCCLLLFFPSQAQSWLF